MQRIFSCVLRLIVKHQDDAKTIRLRGSLVTLDPQGWDADMDVTIDTGLGTGSRERDLSMLQGIAAKQEQYIMQSGDPYNEICNIGHLFATYRKMAEAANIKNPESYFPVITQDQVTQMRQQRAEAAQNQPPDPALQVEQAKLQIQQMNNEAKLAMDQQKAVAQGELQRQKQEGALALQAAVAEAKMQLDRERQESELAFREREAALNARLKQEEMRLEAFLTEQANLMKLSFSRSADTNINGGGV